MRKGDQTKLQLAEALGTLLRENPTGRVTVRQVTECAGVDRQTFYYHFDTMDDVATLLCRELLAQMMEGLRACNDARQAFHVVMRGVAEHAETLRILLARMGRATLRDLLYDDCRALLADWAHRFVRATGVGKVSPHDLDFAIEYCLEGSVSLIISWLEGRRTDTPDVLADRLHQAFEHQLRGLAASGYSGFTATCTAAMPPV